ncbi:hypothetical protein M3T53_03400 [Actinomyces sp. B33]|uniref:hypothetical protein n=1 Tax=Actinomyces sp. B33 TaxID=2942131 RepID=UPI0023416751|nr:hypothetical protein [Actinomyces sp. B33]MDC4232763.1 hypothetical protein [Actinomyces sp. B33]
MTKLYRSGLFHYFIGGGALAAAVEVREGFDAAYPAVFYSLHGLIAVAALAWLFSLLRIQAVPLSVLLRDLILLILLLAIAHTASVTSLFVIPILSIGAALIATRAGGIHGSGADERSRSRTKSEN